MEDQIKSAEPIGGAARPIVIAATFTADPLQAPLRFWMQQLALPTSIRMAAYGQVIQAMLDSGSSLRQNQRGCNVVLVRLEDWIRDRQDRPTVENIEHLRAIGAQFAAAASTLRSQSSAALLVVFCPSSESTQQHYAEVIEAEQAALSDKLSRLSNIQCVTHADVSRLYPVYEHEDPRGDRIGHIPYTTEYFAALATLLARRINAMIRPAYKVIAIDCDNTLWKGICGEDGIQGIELTPAHLELQKLLVKQHEAGMLLCLCSKNNPEDVSLIFDQNPAMVLRDEHLVSSRVNWTAKSANLRSLAAELNLGLDSFILLDDSAMECAEVSANAPGVLALQVPGTAEEITHFLDHVWAFDRISVSKDAKQRTAQYKQNRARAEELQKAGDLRTFLQSLDLQVEIRAAAAEHLTRVGELVQRTNQFNLTGRRRTLSEIEVLWKMPDAKLLVVHVRDRFGDYGLVGALFLERSGATLAVDTFVLSCRVLARGVEHRIVNELARLAQAQGLESISFGYKRTARNVPVRTFLERTFGQYEQAGRRSADERSFVVPVEFAAQSFEIDATEVVEDDAAPDASRARAAISVSVDWHEAALRLSRIPDLLRQIDAQAPRMTAVSAGYIEPRTPFEMSIANLWASVLKIDKVGALDDFFQLGGDSLLAVQVVARIESSLGAELPLHAFFEASTVEEVAKQVAGSERVIAPIERVEREAPMPLSSSQRRLWLVDQMEGSDAYHVPVALRMRGELQESALRRALDSLIERHEALRTVFFTVAEEVWQRVLAPSAFQLLHTDLRSVSAGRLASEIRNIERDELSTPFDLRNGPPIRGRLLKCGSQEHVLLINMHHIASDGWSIGVLLRELVALYDACARGGANPLPPLQVQYVDYAQWQCRSFVGSAHQRSLDYWKQHLSGAPQVLELPTDRARPAARRYLGSNVRIDIAFEVTADLKALARTHKVTLAMSLYTAWAIVLSRLSGQEDVVIGMPVANRRRTELEGLVGFFVNTLAIRVRLDADAAISEVLDQVKATMLSAYAHQDVPFEQVVEAVQPERSLSRSSVFQVIFALQNAPREVARLPGLSLAEQEVLQHTAQFDLSLSLAESLGGISGTLNYDTDLFEASTVERWAGYFQSAVRAVARTARLAVSQVPLMTADERRQVLEQFNAMQRDFEPVQVIHKLFEAHAHGGPEAIAVICGSQQLTYGELNRRANQLAQVLINHGLRPDDRVAVCMERSADMIVALLAVLKAGGAYVPFDLTYPTERLSFMASDSKPRIVLTEQALRARVDGIEAIKIVLDELGEHLDAQLDRNPEPAALGLRVDHLAYIVYTSGSTGVPKGVAVEHRHIHNMVRWHQQAFDVRPGMNCSCLAAQGFDAAVWEIWGTLCAGATLFLVPQQQARQVDTLLSWWASQSVHLSFLTTPMAEFVFDKGLWPQSLRVLLTGGDRLRRRPRPLPFLAYNNYGPTEITVAATSGLIDADGHVLHIGRPIANTRIYILDRHGEPTPIGVGGEVFIGGSGVARGYLNRPEQSQQRFVPDVFSDMPGARMYRTGDLARWRADGTIEFIGRNDDQVKIRGFRIEMGEIEARLSQCDGVKGAVVLAHEDTAGDKFLVAYVTCQEAVVDTFELQAQLKRTLPEYMLPRAFVTLEEFPLTQNGKVDRRALPAPDLASLVSREYEVPVGNIEQTIADIWEALLSVPRIGRDDDFFALGGHSMLAMQAVARLRGELSVDVSMRMLFEFPTVKLLAAALDEAASEDWLQDTDEDNLDELLRQVEHMPEGEVGKLLQELRMEVR